MNRRSYLVSTVGALATAGCAEAPSLGGDPSPTKVEDPPTPTEKTATPEETSPDPSGGTPYRLPDLTVSNFMSREVTASVRIVEVKERPEGKSAHAGTPTEAAETPHVVFTDTSTLSPDETQVYPTLPEMGHRGFPRLTASLDYGSSKTVYFWELPMRLIVRDNGFSYHFAE